MMLNPWRWLVLFYIEFKRNIVDLFQFFRPAPHGGEGEETPGVESTSEARESHRKGSKLISVVSPLLFFKRFLFDFALNARDLLSFFIPQLREDRPPPDPQMRRRFLLQCGVLAICVCIFGLLISYSLSGAKTKLRDSDIAKLRSAIESGDDELAETIGHPILLSPSDVDPALRFEYAKVLIRRENLIDAEQVLSKLAPGDAPGYEPAHLYQANRLINSVKSAPLSKELTNQVLHHLQHSGNETMDELQIPWARYCYLVGDYKRAIPFVKRVSLQDPHFLLLLADLYQHTGDPGNASQALEQAYHEFSRISAKENSTSAEAVTFSAAAMALGKLDEAEKTLRAFHQPGGDETISKQLASLCVLRFDDAVTKHDGTIPFEFLTKSLEYSPANDAALSRIERLFETDILSPSQRKAGYQIFQRLIEKEQRLGLAYYVISTEFIRQGKMDLGRSYLEKAVQHPDANAIAYNNLAWIRAFESASPDLNNAEQLVLVALEKDPNNPRIRDTYANILFKQERYEASLAEFEKVLSSLGGKAEIHLKIATIYDKLGNHRYAELHRLKAGDIGSKSKK